jgi:pyridoxamine 5'-phosphate oxidase
MSIQDQVVKGESFYGNRKDLKSVEADTWTLLSRAVEDRGSGWRLPVVASRSDAGVRQRTMVLRAVDVAQRTMLVHTDVRSPKVTQIRADDRVSMLFYDSVLAVQLSVTATASIHTTDGLADDLWQASHPLSLKYCLGPYAPGTPVAAPTVNMPEDWIDRTPTHESLNDARRNFAVVAFAVRNIDWLSLSRAGNLRAIFEYTIDHPESVNRQWLAP